MRDATLARGSLIGGERRMQLALSGAKPDDADRFRVGGWAP